MSDFFNEALKGGLDSLTADQLDELIIMAQAKRSESKGKKEMWLSLLISQRKSPDYGIYQRI